LGFESVVKLCEAAVRRLYSGFWQGQTCGGVAEKWIYKLWTPLLTAIVEGKR